MRIFIGLTEVANCVHNYSKGFREHGADVFTVLAERARAYRASHYDVILAETLGTPPAAAGLGNALRRLVWRVRYHLVVLRAVITCDVFIFNFGSSFRSDRWDFHILRALGKRIICVFLGDDTRYWYAYTREAEILGTDGDIRPYLDEVLKGREHDYLAVKLQTVRKAEAYAHLILAVPDAAQLQVRPYMRLNIPIDLSGIEFGIPDREVPLIVHAPSVRNIKGTDHVLAAIDQLRAEGIQFEFRLIEGLPNDELRALLEQSDIVIDQMYSETIATFALEGLAAGNVVLARYLADRVRVGPDCPVVNVNVHTLVGRLREVILNRGLRRQLASAGRPYVEKHHSHLVVTRQILDWLESPPAHFDFYPSFFADHFSMSVTLAERERKLIEAEPAYMRALAEAGLAGVRFDQPNAVEGSRSELRETPGSRAI